MPFDAMLQMPENAEARGTPTTLNELLDRKITALSVISLSSTATERGSGVLHARPGNCVVIDSVSNDVEKPDGSLAHQARQDAGLDASVLRPTTYTEHPRCSGGLARHTT